MWNRASISLSQRRAMSMSGRTLQWNRFFISRIISIRNVCTCWQTNYTWRCWLNSTKRTWWVFLSLSRRSKGKATLFGKLRNVSLPNSSRFSMRKRKLLRKSSKWAGNVRAFMLLVMGCSLRIGFTQLMNMALYVCSIWAITTCLLHQRFTKMMPGFSRLKSSLCISTTLLLRWKSLPRNFSRCLEIMGG